MSLTKTNIQWIRNFSAYSEPMTLHALGGPAGSRRTLMQQGASGGRPGWRPIENPTPSIDTIEDQSCRISSRL